MRSRWWRIVEGRSVRYRAALVLGTPFLVEVQIRIHRIRHVRSCKWRPALGSGWCRTSLNDGLDDFCFPLIDFPLLFSGRQRALSTGIFLAGVVVGDQPREKFLERSAVVLEAVSSMGHAAR